MPDVDRLREEAELASGFGTSEQVDRVEWAGTLRVGDVLRVSPGVESIPEFTAPIRGFSTDIEYLGKPLVRIEDAPVEPDSKVRRWVVIDQCDDIEVVSGDD